MKKIAIIGAGLTGLTLAHQLKNKFTVTVFDKARRAGGRIASKEKDGFAFDYGAQYFTVKSTEFHDFIQPMLRENIISSWDAHFVELDGSKLCSQRTWTNAHPHYVGNPDMNAICRYLAASLDVRVNTHISQIEAGNRWCLLDNENKDHGDYDWVIITTPPQQASQLVPTSFKFYSRLTQINMVGCYSLMLGFETRPPINFDAAIVTHADISWISVNDSKPGRVSKPSLVVHSSNQWAEKNMESDETTTMKHMQEVLLQVTGLDTSNAVYKKLHRWRYANIGPQEPKNDLIDYDQQIAVCGDWCIQGRVESAFLAGTRLAELLTS